MRQLGHVDALDEPTEGEYTNVVNLVDTEAEANVVTSLVRGEAGPNAEKLHAPVIDVDIPCRYVESSTPGHGHLYFDSLRLTWEQYEALLSALVAVGIVEPGYLGASQARGFTAVRLPHVKKLSPCSYDHYGYM